MKTPFVRNAMILALVLPLVGGCNTPTLGTTNQGLQAADEQDIDAQWRGKGFGFIWDEATPNTAQSDSPLRFSGVAYGCTLDTFYANLELSGPMAYVSEYQSMNSRGSGTMNPAVIPLIVEGKRTYDVEIPMTGAALFRGGTCDVTYAIDLEVKIDLQDQTADISRAVMSEGTWTCTTDEGYTASIPFPALPLPTRGGIKIQVLDTDECLRDLEGTR